MRLIYAGHCLDNTKTLQEIFNKRHEGMENTDMGPQVIHMVCAPTIKEPLDAGIRRRNVAASSNNARYKFLLGF